MRPVACTHVDKRELESRSGDRSRHHRAVERVWVFVARM